MSVTPFDSAIYRQLMSDEELAAVFRDEAEIRSLLDVEAALARAEGKLGVIPKEAASRIDGAARSLSISPASLAAGTAASGVPITALLAELRRAAGDAAPYVHFGATSQDIVDTALILRLRTAGGLLMNRLVHLAGLLAKQADVHRKTVMAGRTRFQQAVPTTFGLKAAGWLAMLCRHVERWREIETRLLMVQFGGAAGTLAALGSRGPAVTKALAQELALGVPPLPWHTQRDTLAELASWLSLVSGALGKIGRDVLLLAQSEVAEVRPSSGGGSSTMPQKANPIAAEILVTLAQANAHQLGAMHSAMDQEHERGGSGWTLEWLSLPQMVVATGAGLNHANALIDGLVVDGQCMAATLQATHGLIMAEAATFALAEHMPRAEAERLVGSACRTVVETGQHLSDALKALTDAPIDYAALRDPRSYLGSSSEMIDRVLAQTKETLQDDKKAKKHT